MFKNIVRLIISTSLFCILLTAISPVAACTPSREAMTLTLEDRIANAPIILQGTVTQGFTTSSGNGYEVIREVEVEVAHYYKGEGATIVHISGFGDGADCLSTIRLGQEAIFYVEGNSATGYQAVYLSAHDAITTVNDRTINDIIAITGEGVAPTPLPLNQQFMRFATRYQTWLLGAAAILLVLLNTFALKKQIRPIRKEKAKRS